MATNVDLSTQAGAQEYPVQVRVWTKANWLDEWAEDTGLQVNSVTWEVAPRIGTAQLYFRYGIGKLYDSQVFETLARKEIDRHFVKIQLLTDHPTVAGATLAKYWYGIVEITRDVIEGSADVPRGRQTILAYGLEHLLYQNPVRSSVYYKDSVTRLGDSLAGLTFNENGVANMIDDEGGANRFTADLSADETDYWSTKDIVRYLCEFHSIPDPTVHIGEQIATHSTIKIALQLDRSDVLPTWDRPVLESHGRTLGQLFNALMPRHRLLGWYTEISDVDPTTLRIVPYTFAGYDLTIVPGQTIPANPNEKTITVHESAQTQLHVEWDRSGQYDQVIVEGAKRRSVFTMTAHVGTGTLEKGWTDELEVEYEKAASEAAGYPASSEVDERRRRNADSRGRDRLRSVFSRFKLPDDWDFMAGYGMLQVPVFPVDVPYGDEDNFNSGVYVYRPHLSLLPTLPLIAGKEYFHFETEPDTEPEDLGLGNLGEELPPFAIIQVPQDDSKWAYLHKVGMTADTPNTIPEANRRWSARIRVNSRIREPAFHVDVTGQPQHVIASQDFDGLAEDRDLGDLDWRNMLATVAVEEDRRVYGAYPHIEQVESIDHVRVLRIDAGDQFRLDFMPYRTCLGISARGTPIFTTGPQWLNDDRAALYRVAKLAYEWYGTERRALRMVTKKITNGIDIGDLITSVSTGPETSHELPINTVVTQVAIEFPMTDQARPAVAQMSFSTAFAQLDPLRV